MTPNVSCELPIRSKGSPQEHPILATGSNFQYGTGDTTKYTSPRESTHAVDTLVFCENLALKAHFSGIYKAVLLFATANWHNKSMSNQKDFFSSSLNRTKENQSPKGKQREWRDS